MLKIKSNKEKKKQLHNVYLQIRYIHEHEDLRAKY
jgi:hypothetical protein